MAQPPTGGASSLPQRPATTAGAPQKVSGAGPDASLLERYSSFLESVRHRREQLGSSPVGQAPDREDGGGAPSPPWAVSLGLQLYEGGVSPVRWGGTPPPSDAEKEKRTPAVSVSAENPSASRSRGLEAPKVTLSPLLPEAETSSGGGPQELEEGEPSRLSPPSPSSLPPPSPPPPPPSSPPTPQPAVSPVASKPPAQVAASVSLALHAGEGPRHTGRTSQAHPQGERRSGALRHLKRVRQSGHYRSRAAQRAATAPASAPVALEAEPGEFDGNYGQGDWDREGGAAEAQAATTIAKECRRWACQKAYRRQKLENLTSERRQGREKSATRPPPSPSLRKQEHEGEQPSGTEAPFAEPPPPKGASDRSGGAQPAGQLKKQPFLRRRSVARRVHQKLDFSAVKPIVECRLSRRLPETQAEPKKKEARAQVGPRAVSEVPVATFQPFRAMIGRADSEYAGSDDLSRAGGLLPAAFSGRASLEETMELALEHASAPPFQGLVKKWYRTVARAQDSRGLRPAASGPVTGGGDERRWGGATPSDNALGKGESRVAVLDLSGLKALQGRLKAGAN